MRPPVPRFVRWAVPLAVIVAVTVAVFQYWGTSQYGTASTHNTAHDTGWAQTQWGPLGPADRDLLVMVRQAELCGGSSGRQAQQHGSSTEIRTIAKRIGVDYGDLDNQVRSVAGKLGVPLPDQPTAQQQGWMKELSGHSGPDFDRMFAQRLRLTDGEVLPAITGVRAGTRNELIRSFAANAAVLVTRHMESLERTGLVDYSRLPEPLPSVAGVSPADQQQRIDQVDQAVHDAALGPATGSVAGNDVNAMVAALVLIAALLAALGLLGTTGWRVRQTSARFQRRGDPRRSVSHRPPHSRHAAQRW